MNIAIIGAGIGGLSSACLLARQGHTVRVFEKNAVVGGKMNEFRENGYRFDTGPSLFTMPEILDQLYKKCGTSLEEQLDLVPLDINTRYFYPDGTRFDNYSDLDLTLAEVDRIAPEDLKAFERFLKYAKALYEKTHEAFVLNPLYDVSDLKGLDFLSFFGIDAFSTVDKRIDSYFRSPYLRQFFKRFTTYNGSSPYQAPATLNVIPHIEIAEGGYYVKGGLYKVAKSLYDLANKLGASIITNTSITEINVNNGRVSKLRDQHGQEYEADIVVANSDSTETILNLIEDENLSTRRKKTVANLEPSCSGFVLMLGINKEYTELIHHNIYFSSDYKREFQQIFREKVMPDDPTIYIANTSHSDPEHAPDGGSNLFILVNAPYLSEAYDWTENAPVYAQKIIKLLEERGLGGLSDSIEVQKIITPADFYERYLSNKGSIYGTSSNSKWSAFLRPRNKSRAIDGLYFVGGSTHPGGGIPLVVQSALNAAELMGRYED